MSAGAMAPVSRSLEGAGLTPPYVVKVVGYSSEKLHDAINAALREACQAADHFKCEVAIRDSAPKGRTFELFIGPLRPHNKR